MTTFNDREKAFENKYAHDEELAFKIHARTNKLVGWWAATQMGKTGIEAENYAVDLVQEELTGDHKRLAEKLLKDFADAKVTISLEDIHAAIERETAIAKSQLLGDKN